MSCTSCTFDGREQTIYVRFMGHNFFSAPIISWNITMKYVFENSYTLLYGSIISPPGTVFKVKNK